MSVSSTTNRISFSGNGSTTVFSFPDYVILNSDVVVLLTDNTTGIATTQILNTDYTLAFIGSQVNGAYPGGANITMGTAPASGKSLTLYRDMAATQATHWTDNDPMPSGTTEFTHDKAVLLIQRLKDQASRAVALKDGFVGTFDPTLPVLPVAGSIFVVNATNDGFAWGPTLTAFNASVAAAAASASAAAASASAASTSATNAASSASAASASAAAASASASSASTSATAAAASAASAAASAAAAAGTAIQEVLAGTFSGGNTTYTLTQTPKTAADLFGILGVVPQVQVTNYTLSGKTVTFTGEDTTSSNFFAVYRF